MIGFMGSGKTTAGKMLSELLGWSFVDLDKRIEGFTGKTINEIFTTYGEVYFRDMEMLHLRNLETGANTIISTGGGTPCQNNNMDFMLDTGITVYLRLTPAELKTRLWGSTADRPLIKNLNEQELLSFIEEKLADREKWYNRSDIILEGSNPDINLALKLIERKINS